MKESKYICPNCLKICNINDLNIICTCSNANTKLSKANFKIKKGHCACSACKNIINKFACSSCNSNFNRLYSLDEVSLIGIVGDFQSGKSSFMNSIPLSNENNYAITDILNNKMKIANLDLVEYSSVPKETQTGELNRLYLEKYNKTKYLLIELTEADLNSQKNEFLKYMTDVIFMIDPSYTGIYNEKNNKIINLINLVNNQIGSLTRNDLKIAFVISKIDLLKKFEINNIEYYYTQQENTSVFDEKSSLIYEEIFKNPKLLNYESIHKLIKEKFKNYKFFGVASFGSEEEDKKIAMFSPIRVFQPLSWFDK